MSILPTQQRVVIPHKLRFTSIIFSPFGILTAINIRRNTFDRFKHPLCLREKDIISIYTVMHTNDIISIYTVMHTNFQMNYQKYQSH